MPDARIIEVADAARGAISSAWGPSAPDAVSRVYEVPIGDPDSESNITGRQVYVFATDYGRAEPATRLEDFREHKLTILIAERFTDPGRPTNAWVDARVYFVEHYIWRPLADPRQPEVLAGVFPWESDVTVNDIDDLVQRKLFLSLVNVTLRELI